MTKPRRSILAPDHPLAMANGHVRVARAVLYDELDGNGAPCHWCELDLIWTSESCAEQLCADHLDGDSLNDDPSNLVPSCRGCNGNRDDGTGYGRRQPKACAWCGDEFMPKGPSTTYCSNSCSGSATARRGIRSEHGTRSRYVRGCRCDDCRAAHSAYMREYEKTRPPRPNRKRSRAVDGACPDRQFHGRSS